MSGQNFDACLDFVRSAEGGYSRDPNDPGNWLAQADGGKGELIGSHYGVTASLLAAWMAPRVPTAEAMESLDLSTFDSIARSRFWNPLAGAALPAGLDLMLFDFGWNCGVTCSAQLLQRMVGATPDGIIGRQTLDALGRITTVELLAQLDPNGLSILHTRLGLPPSSGIGPELQRALLRRNQPVTVMVLVLSGMQERAYRGMTGFRRYGRGWLARNRRRAETAMAMVNAASARQEMPEYRPVAMVPG